MLDRALEVIDDRQHLLERPATGLGAGVVEVALGALAAVLDVRYRAQVLVPVVLLALLGGGQRRLELADAGLGTARRGRVDLDRDAVYVRGASGDIGARLGGRVGGRRRRWLGVTHGGRDGHRLGNLAPIARPG
jgi:hypothetical protein